MKTISLLLKGASPRERIFRVLALTCLSLLLVNIAFRGVRGQCHGAVGDWGIHHLAGANFNPRAPLYDIAGGYRHTFKGPPAVAMACAWMSWMPPGISRLIWFFMDMAFLLGIFLLSMRHLYPPDDDQPAPVSARWWLAGGAFLLSLRYIMNQSVTGDIATLFVMLSMLSFTLADNKRETSAGATLASATALKLVPLCFMPYVVCRRRGYLSLLGYAAAVALLFLLPALWLGWGTNLDLHLQWAHHVGDTNVPLQLYRVENISIRAQLCRFLHQTGLGVEIANLSLDTIRNIWLALSCLCAAALYAWIWITKRSTNDKLRSATHLSLLLLFMTLFNPLAWRYNFVALILPYFLVLESFRRAPRKVSLRVVLVSLAWLFNSPRMSGDWGIRLHALGIRTWGTLLLAVAVFVAYRAVNQPQPACDPDSETDPPPRK